MDNVDTIVNILKKFNIILFILFGCSAVITFDIFGIRERIGLVDLDKLYLSVIGIIFLVTSFCLIFLIFSSIFIFIKNYLLEKLSEKNFKKNLPEILQGLSNKEIVVMMQFFVEQSNTVWLPIDAPEVSNLSNKNLIFLSSTRGRNLSNGMIICHYSVNEEIKEDFANYLQTKITQPFDKNANLFMRENMPIYINEIREHKRIWKI
ncbi:MULTISPECIES: super-infection exclusion protein B [Acinetobacter]|uniref:super-infection exclusion protein B n=1 Tax=Acinetobacter TaxID=469 RepID=UPI0013601BB1|nr:super-infection exclusion protein B [Acinetobacter baumannii]MBF6940718.1 super-infection exclusion protein B [Acinetobacter baumannii]MBK5976529.1 superinfection exclusion B family protein [Acinetobacter baumannii]MCR0076810.1 superinfection exclusion B family protein [Acinetobacter baumannii]MCZ3315003.1 superinfection exclusion B family protein [Acinetobacter baumannii]MDC4027599.1 superinfection exclusion B family protein [Acinetobacter baumannii]